MEPPTVLVVEDNDANLKLACDVLRLHGFRTVAARSGEEALRQARASVPTVVLVDVQLPDMDGVAVLSALRGDERTSAVPVVAVTAFAMRGDRERLLAHGFDAYIAKPIDVQTFAGQVAALIGASP